MSRVLIFDRGGNPIAEIDAITTRSWVLNDEGMASFEMSTMDTKCREEYLQFGNFVLIQHEELPDWVGVIDGERTWKLGRVGVTAYTPERLLKNYASPTVKAIGTAGVIFETILAYYSTYSGFEMPLLPGSIYRYGALREEMLGDQAYTHVTRMQMGSGCAFFLRGEVGNNGRLVIRGDWLETIGVETGRLLAEGLNLELQEPMMSEYTPIWNCVTGLGDTTSSNLRLSVTKEDKESIARYGKRSISVVFTGTNVLSALEQSTLSYLQANAYPRVRVPCTIVRASDSDSDDIFQTLGIGNTYSLELYSVGFSGGRFGFEGTARILAMRYTDTQNKVEAEIEVRYG